MTSVLSAPARPAYPTYDSLWHLTAIGVMEPDGRSEAWSACDPARRRTRVAIIDTSVAVDHLNIAPNVNRELALDLFSTALGAFPYHPEDRPLAPGFAALDTPVADDLPQAVALLEAFRTRLGPGAMPRLGCLPATSPAFSNHGTAIAGLVCGVPAYATVREGAVIEGVDPARHDPSGAHPLLALPYAGVDPFCEIVPISTSFDPDPDILTLAFLYADMIDADVVLLPRDAADPWRTVPELNQHEIDGELLGDAVYPVDLAPQEKEKWRELAEIIVRVSRRRPIVCAGGNEQEIFGIYPANLAADDNGIISVGAMNAKGFRAAYSAHAGMTVVAPSSDGELFDRTEIRLDVHAADYDPAVIPAGNQNDRFSHFEIISTDVPGKYGYTSSPFADPETTDGLREFNSLYCRFGGTSAASAITAGFLSLAISSGRLPREADGIAARAWLMAECRPMTVEGETVRYLAWGGRCTPVMDR